MRGSFLIATALATIACLAKGLDILEYSFSLPQGRRWSISSLIPGVVAGAAPQNRHLKWSLRITRNLNLHEGALGVLGIPCVVIDWALSVS